PFGLSTTPSFGLSLSKAPEWSAGLPFDRLRANGGRDSATSPFGPSTTPPFGLSLSKAQGWSGGLPFDRLRANGAGDSTTAPDERVGQFGKGHRGVAM
ncbi:hypothetical protein, partial [Ideonella sp. YS5]|uniref:hypothetical protein n=1 Tax=Ideonella sp. YS5 TaxID=3453714 RepID=UPI003EEE7F32